MKNIFEFNHIDETLDESEIKTRKDFYSHYHKKYWCFKKSYKRYKKLDEMILILGVGLVAVGTIAGGLTLNPIVLGVINGSGVLVGSIGKIKNYKKKMEMCQIAFKIYQKVLVELRSALRGDSFNKLEFIERMKLTDEIIIDQTPIADKFIKSYKKKMGCNPPCYFVMSGGYQRRFTVQKLADSGFR